MPAMLPQSIPKSAIPITTLIQNLALLVTTQSRNSFILNPHWFVLGTHESQCLALREILRRQFAFGSASTQAGGTPITLPHYGNFVARTQFFLALHPSIVRLGIRNVLCPSSGHY